MGCGWGTGWYSSKGYKGFYSTYFTVIFTNINIHNFKVKNKWMKMVSAAKFGRAERELRTARVYGSGATGDSIAVDGTKMAKQAAHNQLTIDIQCAVYMPTCNSVFLPVFSPEMLRLCSGVVYSTP